LGGTGAPRIHGELTKLGIRICQSTVAKYMPPRRNPHPSGQSWKTFLENHLKTVCAVDFLTVPTATFRVLFLFVVLSHDRRRVLHLNVTDSPSAAWTGQQIINAFPEDTAPKYLLRDRDSIFGKDFVRRVKSLDIEQLVTAPRSPWQNPYVERFWGSLRRECLDHCVVLGERHLHRIVSDYVAYYHASRTHLGLKKDTPNQREVEPPHLGSVRSRKVLGGLHHRYFRRVG
jgi:transposase InsO family protein